MNNIVLMGRLTANPELKATTTGKEVCNFTIAVDRGYQKGEDRQADFVDIVAWGKTAAFVCQYFNKGKPIAITGRLQTRLYEASDGSKRKAVEVVAGNVEFVLSSKSEGNTGASAYAAPAVAPAPSVPQQSNMDVLMDVNADGDLPF